MSEIKDTDQKTDIPTWLRFVALFVSLTALLAITAYIWQFWGQPFGDQSQFGLLGDYIGGLLNPILTFFTIFLLVWSINKQLEELDLTRKELELTRQELKQSAKALDSAQNAHHKSYDLQLNEVKRIQLQQALDEQYADFKSSWTLPLITVGAKGISLTLEDIFDLHKHSHAGVVKSLVSSVHDRMNADARYEYDVETITLKSLKSTLRRICQFTGEIYQNIESPPIASALHTKASRLNDKMLSIRVLSDNEYNINKAFIRLPDHLIDLI